MNGALVLQRLRFDSLRLPSARSALLCACLTLAAGLAGGGLSGREASTVALDHRLPQSRFATVTLPRLDVRFGLGGAVISSATSRVSLDLASVGRPGASTSVAPITPRWVGGTVSYARGGVREWFVNGRRGLEQGFDLTSRPRGEGILRFSIAVSGIAGILPDGRGGALLALAHGGMLRYTGLSAFDAHGRALKAWISVRTGRLWLFVDDRGASYPLRVDPFVQTAELTASDGIAGDDFGTSVAVSGGTIAVGGIGAVYVFTEQGQNIWQQAAKLTASDAGSGLGNSVAIDGDTIVAGADSQTVNSHSDQGAVYVWTKPAGGWQDATQTAELTASDGNASDQLGWAVGVSGSTIVAGAPSHAAAGGGRGAVYVWTEPAGGWPVAGTETAELTASDNDTSNQLGWSVAVSGATIASGAPGHTIGENSAQGAVYVFTEPVSGGWKSATQTAILTPSDAGAEPNSLGNSLAMTSDTIAAAAPAHQVGSNLDQGAIYVFTMPPGGWADGTQTAELTASDGTANQELGGGFGSDAAVGISGDSIVAGAYSQTVANNNNEGVLYSFTKPAGGWGDATQTQELTASDGTAGETLGWSAAVDGNTIVGGAPGRFSGASPGKAYLFTSASATPAATATSLVSSRDPSAFGQAVSFTATVSNTTGSSPPTGSVQFVVDGSDLGAPVPVSAGAGASSTATSAATTSLSVVGSPHSVTAEYVNADGGFNDSNGSLSGGQTVEPALTAVSLTSSRNPSRSGQPVTFTATVVAKPPGAGVPTGMVTFLDGGVSFAAQALASGAAAFTSATMAVGAHTITAEYSGDPQFQPSSSVLAGNPQVVSPPPGSPTLKLSPSPFDFGQVPTGKRSAPQTLTIQNLSSGTVTLGPLAIANGRGIPKPVPSGLTPAIATSSDRCTGAQLISGASCTVGVSIRLSLRPSAKGSPPTGGFGFELAVASLGGGARSLVLVRGTLVAGVLGGVPDPFDFGAVPAGKLSAPRTLTIRNLSNGVVGVGSVGVVSGRGVPAVVPAGLVVRPVLVSNNGCKGVLLAAGASCTMDVSIHVGPPAGGKGAAGVPTGRFAFSLAVASSSGGPKSLITVTGTVK
jgi:hypothetical protein